MGTKLSSTTTPSNRNRFTSVSLAAVFAVSTLVAAAAPLFLSQKVSAAATTVVVTPANEQGWSRSDTRVNGSVNFVLDVAAPLGDGALQLKTTTPATPGSGLDKAQYLRSTVTPLSSVTTLSYFTKQNAASFEAGLPSYQLPTCLYGVTATGCVASPNTATTNKSFATFVYEPYVDKGNAAVVPGTWQQWDVDAGKFWSTRTEGAVVASQGEFTYTLDELKSAFPNAVVVQYGVNVGSNNPEYDVLTDAFVFNETTYDFEVTEPVIPMTPTSKADCKNQGYKNFVDNNGNKFKNQGQCIKYVNDNKTTVQGGIQFTAYDLRRQVEFLVNTADEGGTFHYSDKAGENYRAKISELKVQGKTAWFAGVVTKSNNPSYVGNWLFAKVEDGNPDKISASFTTEAAAKAGVEAMGQPGDGPFTVTQGTIKFKD